MSSVTTITNPLMQPIQYHGQTYFTGQYFHQMYRNNSDTGGKYKQTGSFIRLIRSIEAYSNYVQAEDIVELTWRETRGNTDADSASLKELFKASNYNPIMLINATAQVALTHHLDDEVSKSVSANANRQIATGQRPITALQQAKTAPVLLDAYLQAGKLLGTDEPMARAVAVDQVRETVGVDFSPLLARNSVEDAPLTPTALGKELGLSGRAVNKALADAGLQTKDGTNSNWEPTEAADGLFTKNPYKSKNSDHTGYQLLWYRSAVERLTFAEGQA